MHKLLLEIRREGRGPRKVAYSTLETKFLLSLGEDEVMRPNTEGAHTDVLFRANHIDPWLLSYGLTSFLFYFVFGDRHLLYIFVTESLIISTESKALGIRT